MPLGERDAARVRGIPLFSGLSERAFQALGERMRAVEVAAGETLFIQDEPADRFMILLDGWVKLYRLSEDGAEAVVNVVAPGETFAEAAMFAQGSFPVCAEAVTAARCLSIAADDFAVAAASDREAVFGILGSLSLRLRQLVRQIESLQVKSAPARLAEFLLGLLPPGSASGGIDLPLNKGLIARRLGMRPETLSRALVRLREEGVETRDGKLFVADVPTLRRFAETSREGDIAGTCR